jgi:acyl dehydratase
VASAVSFSEVAVGTALPPVSFPVTRADLVRYAGASGDFNVIHWNQRVAQSVGLPDVIAHGMLTMAMAARVVTDWVVDPAAVLEYGVRFTRPVPVPDDDVGATLDVTATVTELLDGRRARVELTATCGGDKVLGMAKVLVQLS